MMATHLMFQSFTQIVDQMKTISDLTSVRGALTRTLCVKPKSVSTYDFHTRVPTEPCCNTGNRSIRQYVRHRVGFQIDDSGSVILTFGPGPIVDSDDP